MSAYVDGMLENAEKSAFEAHIHTCKDCKRELDLLKNTLILLADAKYSAPENFTYEAVSYTHLIGAVSPQGGDFSEPVTQNTKRFIRCFWALDRSLAYQRHYPAINWLTSYSEYSDDLKDWFDQNVSEDFDSVVLQIKKILTEESSLMEIVKLIGSDVLPDSQRLVLEVAKIVRLGFLQQNAFNPTDTYVPLKKQYLMLKTCLTYYEDAKKLIAMGVPVSQIRCV